MLIDTVMGDIADVEADAIVNAANSALWMGSGVAGAIKRKGGSQIESEAVSKGPIAVGEAVATSAGFLRAEWVIHAAVMGQDLKTDGTKIQMATISSLRLATELNAESIALPSLGTGVGGFPMRRAAEIMIQVALDHANRLNRPRHITFVLFSEDCKEAFDRALEKAGKRVEVSG